MNEHPFEHETQVVSGKQNLNVCRAASSISGTPPAAWAAFWFSTRCWNVDYQYQHLLWYNQSENCFISDLYIYLSCWIPRLIWPPSNSSNNKETMAKVSWKRPNFRNGTEIVSINSRWLMASKLARCRLSNFGTPGRIRKPQDQSSGMSHNERIQCLKESKRLELRWII